MDNQKQQPGKLLKKLRNGLGYSIEDWAMVFDTDPVTIAGIEAGHEMSTQFLTALIEWFVDGLENPLKSTDILPDGWKDDLPKALNTLLNALEQKNMLLEDLQQAYELQKKAIDQGNERAKSYQRQIENYLEIVTKQHDKIKALEGIGKIKSKTNQYYNKLNYALLGVAFFMAGGVLFKVVDEQLTHQAMHVEAAMPKNAIARYSLPVPQMTIHQQMTTPQVNVSKTRTSHLKTAHVETTHVKATHQGIAPPLRLQETASAQKIAPLSGKVLAKAVDQPKKTIATTANNATNEKLFDLLAVNENRVMPVPQKYTSDKGRIILKFDNPTKDAMVIAISNEAQEEVHRDTIQGGRYLLDLGKFAKGKYYYRVFSLAKITQKTTGSFLVEKE